MSRYWVVFGSLAVAGLMAAQANAAGGCGAGFHLNSYGSCVRNRGAVVVAPATGVAVTNGVAAVGVAPAAGVAIAKRCPLHYHLNGNGVCRHN